MASERQIAANQANAKRSTGPQTEAGKLKSSRNAFKHGLSRPLLRPSSNLSDDRLSPDLTDIARSQLELSRIRRVRTELIAALLQVPDPHLIKQLRGLGRYERAARAKRKKAMPSPQTKVGV